MMVINGARCACKVGRCETCSLCRRCGCAHDGIAVAVKMARKPGQHGRPKPPALRPKRATNNYKNGELFESPLIPEKPQKGKYSIKLPPPSPPASARVIQSPTDLFKAFDIENRLSSFYFSMHTSSNAALNRAWHGGDHQEISQNSARHTLVLH